jgi:hypothetical protein|tara:strand:+ start:260 stop:487 length:228 start_codon:yes stop_codon:yes gene_type:complete
MSLKEKKLTPFEQAEYNIKKFNENCKLYDSYALLLEMIEKIEDADEETKKDLEAIFKFALQSFSEHDKTEGSLWN